MIRKVLEESKGLAEDEYEPEAWTRFAAARNAAQALLDAGSDDAEALKAAYDELLASIANLKEHPAPEPEPEPEPNPSPSRAPIPIPAATAAVTPTATVVAPVETMPAATLHRAVEQGSRTVWPRPATPHPSPWCSRRWVPRQSLQRAASARTSCPRCRACLRLPQKSACPPSEVAS